MWDLQKVSAECKAELKRIGITTGYVKEFRINTRAKSRWGLCKRDGSGYIIEISDRLLSDDAPLIALKNTVVHELLHTCKGTHGHDAEWKRLAEKVNAAYGYGIKRCSSAEEKGIQEIEVAEMPVKHRFQCEKCNSVIDRYRESKFTKNYQNYRCGCCNGRIKKIF